MTTTKPNHAKQTILSTDLTRMKYTPAQDILVKSPSNFNKCWLNSLLLLPGDRLLLADSNNDKVKLVDLSTSTLVAEVSVITGPWGMCLLPGDRVAVCLTGSIQFLETRGQLSLGESIGVNGNCYGVVYDNNFLIVSFQSGVLQKMDMEGNVLKVTNDSAFKTPFYLTIVSEGPTKAIYVSDEHTNTITKLDMNLNILQTFQDHALKGPRDITAVGNQLLICGWNSHNIMCLDLPSGEMTQLLGANEGIASPRNACYSQQQNKMYVCDHTYGHAKNYVKVYSLN
ncbi:uncharacterized protein LOC128220632 [Mya arenaria]|uniref:uncharacterized protein LOC128220632 n=1 Tax=Mya arenaria TaxID=6604 RepID=UPI0022DF1410|nr:uncharacterized protein LOC128220632 [Mya arenaria]XP_052785068.1 uncharacterized protein LOC128220632 [Mya arenaria]